MNLNEKAKTDSIFELVAPFDNPYQGRARRVVFCCTAGLLRSPTAAHLGAIRHGMNTRSVGTHECALQRLSVNLIEWANQVVFMNRECSERAMNTFAHSDSQGQLLRKMVVWHIPDEHDYMAPALVEELTPLLAQLHQAPIYCPSW